MIRLCSPTAHRHSLRTRWFLVLRGPTALRDMVAVRCQVRDGCFILPRNCQISHRRPQPIHVIPERAEADFAAWAKQATDGAGGIASAMLRAAFAVRVVLLLDALKQIANPDLKRLGE